MSNYLRCFIVGLLACLVSVIAVAQTNNETPQMADAMRADGKIYVVVAVVGIIMLGIFLYLISVDRKVSRLEKK